MYGARFMLRKYVCSIQAVTEEWERYEQRSMWERMRSWISHDRLDNEREYKDVYQLIVSRSRSLLMEQYGYEDISEELEHLPDKAAVEKLADKLGEEVRQKARALEEELAGR